MTTLKALLDHVKKKNDAIRSKEEEEPEYEYEYVYDYVEVGNSREEKAFTTPKPVQIRARPKIIPKQRKVPSDSEFHHKNRQGEDKQPSLVTAPPINLGAPVTRYNAITDSLEIINPAIIIQEPPATRRAPVAIRSAHASASTAWVRRGACVQALA